MRHMPGGTHPLAPRVLADCKVFACPVDIPEMARQAEARRNDGWPGWPLPAKRQRGGGLADLPSPGFLWGPGFAVFPEKEGFREHQHPAKPPGQETVIAHLHDASAFHVFLSVKWSAWQGSHLQPSRLKRDASVYWATRGWCPRPDLHRHFARFKCAVSALDYVGEMVPREGVPPPTSPF